jgi:hypothetical protein
MRIIAFTGSYKDLRISAANIFEQKILEYFGEDVEQIKLDEFATLFTGKSFQLQRIGFSSSIKSIAKELTWNGREDPAGKRLLREFGRIWREYYPHTWIKMLEDRLVEPYKLKLYIIIDDLRFSEEAFWVRTKEGKVIKVDNDHTFQFGDNAIRWDYEIRGEKDNIKQLTEESFQQLQFYLFKQ